jgi:transcriptional regulator with PAS, ATPase and Fis domain
LGNNTPNGAALAPVSNGVHLNGNGSHQPVAALKNFIRDQEVAYINRAMAQAGGDKEKAAEILDISLATLYRKLAEVA